MILASVYGNSDKGDPNRLRHWLKLKQWSLPEAAALIADVDPESLEFGPDQKSLLAVRTLREPEPIDDGEDYEDDELLGGEESHEQESPNVLASKLKRHYREIRDLERLLGRVNPKREFATPVEWISAAVEHDVHIPWLAWAEWERLVKLPPKPQAQNEKAPTEKERQSMLKIIAALCVEEKLDMKHATKSAEAIVRQCALLGLGVSVGTVTKYIKAARELPRPDK
jgi:hypothetical protein